MSKKLIRGASVYVIGNILQKAAAFLLIPIYVQFLSPEQFGIAGFVQTVGQFFVVFLSLGNNSAVQRHYYEYYQNDSELKRYISTTFLFTLIVAGVASLVFFFFGKPLWSLIANTIPFAPYAQLMIVTVWGITVTQYITYLYRAEQQSVKYIITQLGQFLLSTAAIIVFVVIFSMEAKGLLLGLLIGSIITAVISSLLMLKRYSTFQLEWKYLTQSLGYGLPLIPHLSAQWIKTSIDQIFLVRYVSLTALGQYNLGYRLGIVMQVLVSSTNLAYTPYFFELMKTHPNPQDQFKKLIEIYIAGFGMICIIGILFMDDVIGIMVPTTYQSSANIARLVLFGYLVNGYYYLAVNPLLFFDKTSWLPWITGVSALTGVGLNLLLIPRYGAIGAAWSFVGSMLLTLILSTGATQRVWNIKLPFSNYILVNSVIFTVLLWTISRSVQSDANPISIITKLVIGLAFMLGSVIALSDIRKLVLQQSKAVLVIWFRGM
jgi:O-antigen/teichoic acid export membrane protein